MPAADQVIPKRKVKVTAKAAPAPARPDAADSTRTAPAPKPARARVRVTVPDAGEATRTRGQATMTPDQADRERTPAQKTRDARAVAQTVKTQRVKAVRAKHSGSWGNAVAKYVKTNVHDVVAGATSGTPMPEKPHGGAGFAVIAAQPLPSKVLVNAAKDTSELAVTTPSSMAHLATTAVTHPKKLPGELAAPYIQLAKNPGKMLVEHPVSTGLMVAPIGRIPGRVAGRVARKTGAQTLERPAATLPGTALKERRTGSRDYLVRKHQAKQDAKNPAPTVTEKQIQRRVDEHYDKAKHDTHRIVGEATKAARKATKGQPKPVRQAAVDAAREQAQQAAKALADERFAREFGANVRLSHGVAAREATHAVRRRAVKVLDAAKATAQQADRAHDTALTAARTARDRAKSSSMLGALERQRVAATKDLAAEQRAAINAKLAHERAHANARVSVATPKTNIRIKTLEAQRRAAVKVVRLDTPEAVTAARRAVSASDRNLNGLLREMQRAEEKASRLEGITVGRYAGGRMTAGAGKRVADHAEYMGHLRDAIAAARRASTTARERLKAAEHDAHAAQRRVAHDVKDAGRAVDQRIAAERKRVGGVAPAEHGALLAAIDRLSEAPSRVAKARARVRDYDQQIAAERQRIAGVPPKEAQALTNAIHARGQAHAVLATARADAQAAAHTHIAAKRAMTNATLIKPSGAGRVFAHKADAATVVKKLNQAAHAPVTFVLHQVGDDRWAAVPKAAKARLYGTGRARTGDMGHYSVGSGKATGAKVMRVSRGAFTNAVLPLSAKWLAGQGAEAGIRAAVAGAGPMDWLRMGKVVKKLNEKHPGSGDELATRITGGHFDLTGPARDFANGKSLAEEFEGTPLAKVARGATAVGAKAPAKAVREGWGHYTRAMLGSINHVIESNARRAMAGQAIKNLGFQDEHLIGLFDKAIDDAAHGLKETHNQVALARAVDRMYGKYQKFSPETRSLLMHWTPFLPWYMNSVNFLFRVLPVDHPVKAALVADVSSAEEQWRKDHGLSLLQGGHVPGFLLGSYPTKGGGSLRVAHYTPFGIGNDPVGAAGQMLLPQISTPVIANMALGVDWKGNKLTRGGSHGPEFNTGEKAIRAVVSALEEHVPGVSQAGAISGLTPRYVDKNSPGSIKTPVQVLKGYLPTTPTQNNSAAPSGGGGGSSSSSGRVKVPGTGAGGRIKIPGVTGRVKVP